MSLFYRVMSLSIIANKVGVDVRGTAIFRIIPAVGGIARVIAAD